MSKAEPFLFWAFFMAVMATLGLLAKSIESAPFGDVTYVYFPWISDVVNDNGIVGIDAPWVYPIGALIPMLVAGVIGGSAHYVLGWFTLVVLLDAIALFFLRKALFLGQTRLVAAWYVLTFMLLLGPVAVSRLDAVVSPILIIGLIYISRSPHVSALFLAVATWLKVWPAALVALAILTLRARKTFITWFVVVSSVLIVTALFMGGGMNVFSFITQQAGRGLQIESVVATPYLWAAMLGGADSRIYFDTGLVTYQVSGLLSNEIASVTTAVLLLVLAGIALIAASRVRSGASSTQVFAAAALAAASSLMAFNKVGSPQFVLSLAAPLVLSLCLRLRFARHLALLGLLIAFFTGLVFPYFYAELLRLNPIMVLLITLRNVSFLVFVGLALTQVVTLKK